MLYRTVLGVAVFFLLATAVVKAQSNTFTVTKYKSEGCFSVDQVGTAVSGVCTLIPREGGYVRAFMAPNSTTNYQYFQYSDSACTQLTTATTGRCGTCTGDKTIVVCPSDYNTTVAVPAFPTTADGYIRETECYDASCSGTTCAVNMIKSSSCLIGRRATNTPTVQAVAASCSNTDGFKAALYTDTSCTNTVVFTNEHVITCASKSASTSSSYTAYRKYDCATANVGSVVVTAPSKGYKTVNYNSTTDTCPGNPISTAYVSNNLCTSSNNITSQAITCNGASSATVSYYEDNQCVKLKSSLTVPVDSTCNSGDIVTCSGASSVVASAASAILAAAALVIQRFF